MRWILLRESLDIEVRVRPDEPFTLQTMDNLATVESELGNLEEVQKLYKKR